MKFRFIDLEKDDLINDTALRNIKICFLWEGMSYSKLKYAEKVQILSEKFHLTPQGIEAVRNRFHQESVETDPAS